MSDLVNSRNGVGAAIGGTVGFFFAGPMGAGLGALVGGAVAHASAQRELKGDMTPARRVVFARAMESINDPAELTNLANAFDAQGLKEEATMLRKRASLRKLPEETQLARRDAFRRAMCSDDPEGIEQVAEAFLHEGALRSAKCLKDHANAVRTARAVGENQSQPTVEDLEGFAGKLGQAVQNFGADSKEAKSAARNLIRAQGKAIDDDAVALVIRAAVSVVAPPKDDMTVKPDQDLTVDEPEPVLVNNAPIETGGAIDVSATVEEEK